MTFKVEFELRTKSADALLKLAAKRGTSTDDIVRLATLLYLAEVGT